VPQLVRAGLRYNRWLETEGRAPLAFPADVITDLRTAGDRISVFEITEAVGAERIAIAVAAGKRDVDQTAYSIFDRAAVEALGISLHKTAGGTYDTAVNSAHYDVHVGSAERLIELAGVIAAGDISCRSSGRELLNFCALVSGVDRLIIRRTDYCAIR